MATTEYPRPDTAPAPENVCRCGAPIWRNAAGGWSAGDMLTQVTTVCPGSWMRHQPVEPVTGAVTEYRAVDRFGDPAGELDPDQTDDNLRAAVAFLDARHPDYAPFAIQTRTVTPWVSR